MSGSFIFAQVEWKVGMHCRALFDENDVIYEATILEIDESNCTALLNMTGISYFHKFTA